MSGELHWRAEDYSWDPHNLRATPREPPQTGKAEQAEDVSEATREAAAEQVEEHKTNEEPPEGAVVPAATSAEEGSAGEMHSGGTRSEGDQSAEEGQVDIGGAASREPVPVVKDTLAFVHGSSKKRIPMQCQVDGCQKDLSKEKEYYQRYRICEDHLKLSSLIKDGIEQRFCQQCGRFHLLADFDADKRSCRSRLNLHNDRRRKRVPEQQTPRQDLANPQPRTRRTRTRSRRIQYAEHAASDELDALEVEAKADSGSMQQQYESRTPKGLEVQSDELGRDETFLPRGMDSRSYPSPLNFSTPYRGYPVGMAALQGLQGLLPVLNTGFSGPAGEEQYMGSPMHSLTHYSQQQLRMGEPVSPPSMHTSSPHLTSEAGLHAAELAWLRQQAQKHDQATSGGGDEVGRTRSDGAGSPLSYKSGLRFRTGPLQDYWYEQQAQLLRDSSSWPSREDAYRLQLAANDLEYAYSGAASHTRRNASASPTVAGTQIQPGMSVLAPRLLSSEGSLAGQHLSERGSQLLSGGSESSVSHFRPIHDSTPTRHTAAIPSRFPAAEAGAAANLHRLSTGASRIEQMPSGHQRLLSSSSPMLPREHLYPSSSDRRSSEEMHNPKMRYSDAVWSQPYQSFHNPQERLHISRSGMKLDLRPEGIPASMREDYLRMLGTSDPAHLEASMRPGCTHITATLLNQGASCNALEAAERLVGCGGVWSSAEMLIQLPDSTAHVQNGQLKAYWSGERHAALQPLRPTPSACAVASGGMLDVRLASDKKPEPKRLLARCNGAFLADIQVEAAEVEVSIPDGNTEGVLWLETECGGVLSRAAPVVLTVDEDIAEEIQGLRNAVTSQVMTVNDVENLVVDIGMVLQYAGYLSHREPGASGPNGLPDGLHKQIYTPPPGCCSVVHGVWSKEKGGPLSEAGYVQYVAQAARRVVAFCCREGWPALAAKVLPVAAVGLKSWADLVTALEELLGKRLLVHAAVSSGCLSMVILILDLFSLSKQEYGLTGSVEGSTALHVAAKLPDGGRMAELLLERCPSSRQLWTSARDHQGCAPADIAYIVNNRQMGPKGAGNTAVAKLCRDTAPSRTPPETPRLSEMPQTSRRPVALEAHLPSHWLTSQGPAAPALHFRPAERPRGAWSNLRPSSAGEDVRGTDSVLAMETTLSESPVPAGAQEEPTSLADTLPHRGFTPSLTVRYSWPGELDMLPSETLTAHSSPPAPSPCAEISKLMTWPLTKVELTSKLKLAEDSCSPMVVDVLADAVVPPHDPLHSQEP